ncbi:hypothetical protein Tco_0625505 [Tanacetum coccineum]|uniref:RNA-directed DNA polymerase, eukaryota, reverse transcriptase zinc-binding domain protein n=1 Tax=Tanacetum coccineum TaxID=301880 RepID=A0ABQ4WH08_9ASTR
MFTTPFNYLGVKVGDIMSRVILGLRNLFNGVEGSDRKLTWIAWKNVLASKEKGGLGVYSYFALNRALLFKWVWRFISQDSSLWSKFIKALHETKGSFDNVTIVSRRSPWLNILREVSSLKRKGIDLLSYARRKVGNGATPCFGKIYG